MFQVLKSSDPQWVNALSHLPPFYHDVHYTQEYVRIFERVYGDVGILAVEWDEGNITLQPVMIRKDKLRADLGSPYGYGGPVSNKWENYREFDKHYSRWKTDNEFISEFIALHPVFALEQKVVIPEAKYVKDTVYIDLTKEPVTRKGHFAAIKNARRLGAVTQMVTPDHNAIMNFKTMYDETMARAQAHERWQFPDDYFYQLFSCLGPKARLFFSHLDGRNVCGCIVIHDLPISPYVYYQFAGSYEHNKNGVNHMMVMDVAVWARLQGAHRLHLGGGVSEDRNDSLLRFKTGFSRDRAPLYIVNR